MTHVFAVMHGCETATVVKMTKVNTLVLLKKKKGSFFFLLYEHLIRRAVCVSEFDWVWDECSRSAATLLSCENRKVSFHSEYSCGTAAIRGSKELSEGQHFWEIKMTSPVYGTDMVWLVGMLAMFSFVIMNVLFIIHDFDPL